MATATDPEAFGTFFRRHVRGVMGFFRRRGASDPSAVLERELLDAARRRAAVTDHQDGSQEPRGPWPSALRPARRRSSLGAFAAVVLSGVAVAVALGALVSLRGHHASSPHKPPAAARIPGRRQLIDILGVLRRPQTSADLGATVVEQGIPQGWGTMDRPLIRRATVTPWGSPVFLIPVKPPIPGPRAVEGLVLFVGSGGSCCATASDILTYGEMTTEGAGRAFAGGASRTRLTVLVPDGVATVEFVLPHPVTVPVHANIAAVQMNQGCCSGAAPMIWRAANGHIVEQVGGALPGAVANPRPGPGTAQSRAAERDPSTPNRVWVTPGVGGPHAVFTVHFRVLLNDADYSYRLGGTSCPAITGNGGDGGGTQDLRGRVWTDVVDAIAGQTWCPGTYHLSATVMDLGRYGQLKHPARPFGTATFTVKP